MMLVTVLVLIAGLIVLTGGADLLVRGSTALAFRLGITPLVVGLTVVAFGTSAPELVVSVDAAMRGSPGIAIGNVVGSNIANIAFILGIAALIRPMRIDMQVVSRDVPIMIAVTAVVLALLLIGTIGRPAGAVLFAGIIAYSLFSYRAARRATKELLREAEPLINEPKSSNMVASIFFIAAGLAGLVVGANLFVGSASEIARALGVSETVIGLSIVAVGTSLPELATAVAASLRKASDIAAGNVVGSNIFNLLCILGAAALVRPFHGIALSPLDLTTFGVTALFVFVVMRTGHTVTRLEGGVLLALYLVYLLLLF